MENQDRFDLEQSLRKWREDCASRPSISFDNARELESDLRERVTDLLKQGLNEKEAFSKAVLQIGSPVELAHEFARENPLALWRERLLWMVVASFVVSVWSLLTSGPLLWFVNTLGSLLPPPHAAWLSLAGNLPLLAVAALLATGRVPSLVTRIRFVRRRHLATAGVCLLAAGVLMRFFGPSSLTSPAPLLAKMVAVSLWPLILLCLTVSLFRPVPAPQPSAPSSGPQLLPSTVWRERVFWIAVAALAAGLWQTVSLLCMLAAMFHTGDLNMPSLGKVWLISYFISFLLIELSPLVALGLLLRHRIRLGKDVTAGRLVRSRAMFAFIPLAVCAWVALTLLTNHYLKLTGSNISWSTGLFNYLATFRWLWPVGLALLILWLAPRRENPTDETLAVCRD